MKTLALLTGICLTAAPWAAAQSTSCCESGEVSAQAPAPAPSPMSLALAAPARLAVPAQVAVRSQGSKRGMIGVYLAEDAERAVVDGLVTGGPAEAAGLEAGDRIVAVDGQPVESWRALSELVAQRRAGQEVALTIERDGWRKELRITLAPAPDAPAGAIGGGAGGASSGAPGAERLDVIRERLSGGGAGGTGGGDSDSPMTLRLRKMNEAEGEGSPGVGGGVFRLRVDEEQSDEGSGSDSKAKSKAKAKAKAKAEAKSTSGAKSSCCEKCEGCCAQGVSVLGEGAHVFELKGLEGIAGKVLELKPGAMAGKSGVVVQSPQSVVHFGEVGEPFHVETKPVEVDVRVEKLDGGKHHGVFVLRGKDGAEPQVRFFEDGELKELEGFGSGMKVWTTPDGGAHTFQWRTDAEHGDEGEDAGSSDAPVRGRALRVAPAPLPPAAPGAGASELRELKEQLDQLRLELRELRQALRRAQAGAGSGAR